MSCGKQLSTATRSRASLLLIALFSLAVGCDSLPPTAPVTGTVYFNEKPLTFGSVTFQPSSGGQPARAEIKPDGTYRLSTFTDSDGAIIGNHRVRIMCTTAQDPKNPIEISGNELMAGKLLIPRKYTQMGSSGLTADVTFEGENKFDFKLTGKP